MISIILLILISLLKYIVGKSLHGVFSIQPGIHYLDRFCFDVNGALKFDLNATDDSLHLLLLTDEEWFSAKNSFICDDLKSNVHHDVVLNVASKVYHFHPTKKKSPEYMNLCYARCNGSTDVAYNVELMNQFYADGHYSHFDYGESDLLSFAQFFFIAYLVAFAMYGSRLYAIVKKGGPMHMALRMLTTTQLLKAASFFVMVVHYYRYSVNGFGFPLVLQLCKVIDGYNHYQMLLMIAKLATAGILSSSNTFLNDEKLMHYIILFVSLFQIIFLVFSQIMLLLLLRILVAVVTASFIQNAVSKERSALKRDFYHKLVRDNYILWWSLPFATILSIVFAEYHHQKLIAVVTTLGQTVSALFMYQLFISRSLYWEVSSLSSATLPLRIDKSFGMKKYSS